MKRRNADAINTAGKLRRATKRSKSYDSYSPLNVINNFKFIIIWSLIIIMNFISDFRFELLYPLWSFFKNSNETFRFKGMAYLFPYIFLIMTIDIICFYTISTQWLFLISSTYVWLQFIYWYTDRSLTLFTLIIWFLLILIETILHLKDNKTKEVPFHQFEICRTLAVHGVGYPIVTYAIECKSYIRYRLRLHKQSIVSKENNFYYSLLKQAIEPPLTPIQTTLSDDSKIIDNINNNNLDDFANSSQSLLPSASSTSSSLSSSSISVSNQMNNNPNNNEQSINHNNDNNEANISTLSTLSSSLKIMLTNSNFNTISSAQNTNTNTNNNSDDSKNRKWLKELKYINNLFFKQIRYLSKCITNSYRIILFYIMNTLLSPKVLFNKLLSLSIHKKSAGNDHLSIKNESKSTKNGIMIDDDHIVLNRSSSSSSPYDLSKKSMINTLNKHSGSRSKSPNECNDNKNIISDGLKSNENENSIKNRSKDRSLNQESILNDLSMSSCNVNTLASSSTNEITNLNNSNTNVKMKETNKTVNKRKSNTSPDINTNANNNNNNNNNLSHSNNIINDKLLKEKNDYIWKIEQDNIRLRSDLQTIKQFESDLNKQLQTYRNDEKLLRNTIINYEQNIVQLQKRLQLQTQLKLQNKQLIQKLEKQLNDENVQKNKQQQRVTINNITNKQQSNNNSNDIFSVYDKKSSKYSINDDSMKNSTLLTAAINGNLNNNCINSGKSMCNDDSCHLKQAEYENELNKIRKDLKDKDEQLRMKKMLIDELRKNEEQLLTTITLLQKQNQQLDSSLKNEKLLCNNLYLTLQNLKRQIYEQQAMSIKYEKENNELKTKILLLTNTNLSSLLLLSSNNQQNDNNLSNGLCNLMHNNNNNELNGFHSSSSSPSLPSSPPIATTIAAVNDFELNLNHNNDNNNCFSRCSPNNMNANMIGKTSMTLPSTPLTPTTTAAAATTPIALNYKNDLLYQDQNFVRKSLLQTINNEQSLLLSHNLNDVFSSLSMDDCWQSSSPSSSSPSKTTPTTTQTPNNDNKIINQNEFNNNNSILNNSSTNTTAAATTSLSFNNFGFDI